MNWNWRLSTAKSRGSHGILGFHPGKVHPIYHKTGRSIIKNKKEFRIAVILHVQMNGGCASGYVHLFDEGLQSLENLNHHVLVSSKELQWTG